MATTLYAYAPPLPPFSTTTNKSLLRLRRATFPTRPSSTFPFQSSSQRNPNIKYKKWSCFSKDDSGEMPLGYVNVEYKIEDEACELVRGREIVLGEGEVTLRAYILEAVKNNNGAGVLLLSDIFGFEDSSTRDFAYRVACSGYNVIIPDLFRGNAWKKDQDHSEFECWLASHPPDRVAKDIATATQWMIDEFVTAGMPKKLGILGFCFGGYHLVQILARDNQEQFSTGVCFYGTSLDISLASHIKVPILFICGDNDPLCPVGVQREMEQNVKGSKFVLYRDRGHGFAHRPQSQEDDEDAESSFVVTRSWLHDFLVVDEDLNVNL